MGLFRKAEIMAMAGRAAKLILSQVGRQAAVRNSAVRFSLPTITTVRRDSIFTKYREPPNGFLFNEKPLKPGEKRQWEDWEAITYVGIGVSVLLIAIIKIYKPDIGYEKEAEREAIRRIAELDAIDAAEAENAANSGSDDE